MISICNTFRRHAHGVNVLWGIFVVMLALFLCIKTLLAVSRAQAYSALASITAALHTEVDSTNGFQNAGFLIQETNDWKTLSDDQCKLLMGVLAKKYSIDGSPSQIGLWGHKVQIQYRMDDGIFYCRVSSRGTYDRSFEYKEFKVPIQVQQLRMNKKQSLN